MTDNLAEKYIDAQHRWMNALAALVNNPKPTKRHEDDVEKLRLAAIEAHDELLAARGHADHDR